MSEFFMIGEEKERSGIYKRIENISEPQAAGAQAGVALALVSGNWGAVNTPVEIDSPGAIAGAIGTGTGAKVLTELLRAGVQKIIVCRAGSGGEAGSLTLKDTATTGANVVTLTAKHPGTRQLTVSVKQSIYDTELREVDIYDGTQLLETYNLTIKETSPDEPQQLVDALAKSEYVIATKVSAGNGTLATINQTPLTGGSDPTVDTTAYSNAANASENQVFNMVVTDSEAAAVHAVIQAFVDRVYQYGKYPMAVFGAHSSTEFDTRVATSRSYNDAKIHYLLNAWTDAAGVNYEGYLGAARIGGLICAGESNVSLTNTSIAGAVELSENLTNSQIIKALKAGALVITKNKSGAIVIEKGINTLNNPAANEDDGWKKIRRVKERFEMFDRIDRTLEPLRAKLNNDDDGRATVIAAILRVLDAMVGEHKLLGGGTVILDPDKAPVGDSAWFKIAVDDIDSLERIYLTYQLRFAPAASAA